MITLPMLMQYLMHNLSSDELFVFGIGDTTKEAYNCGFQPQNSFFMTGGWGCPPAVGIGLAIATPHKQVNVIDGDGSLLHSPSFLATLKTIMPANYHLITIFNGILASSGKQSIEALDGNVSLKDIIHGFGFKDALEVKSSDSLELIKRESCEPKFSIVSIEDDEIQRKHIPQSAVLDSFTPAN